MGEPEVSGNRDKGRASLEGHQLERASRIKRETVTKGVKGYPGATLGSPRGEVSNEMPDITI